MSFQCPTPQCRNSAKAESVKGTESISDCVDSESQILQISALNWYHREYMSIHHAPEPSYQVAQKARHSLLSQKLVPKFIGLLTIEILYQSGLGCVGSWASTIPSTCVVWKQYIRPLVLAPIPPPPPLANFWCCYWTDFRLSILCATYQPFLSLLLTPAYFLPTGCLVPIWFRIYFRFWLLKSGLNTHENYFEGFSPVGIYFLPHSSLVLFLNGSELCSAKFLFHSTSFAGCGK